MNSSETDLPTGRTIIQDASAWILRIGVVASVVVMIIGISISALHNHVSVERMQTDRFEYRPSLIAAGVLSGHGKAVVEVGICILVFTPIVRVMASMLLFLIEERDKLYAGITLTVLLLTLAGLLTG